MTLPLISHNVYANTKNAEAAIQFAEWSLLADYDKAVKAYADCHRDPNIDDSYNIFGMHTRGFM